MGYLDNTTVTVDAILTNKGREILAAGGRLNIVKFALSDDEIDYDLWNPAHTLGTNFYGKVIEDMPVLEALPDETQMLRYKLITLPKDVIGIPVISVTPSAVRLSAVLPRHNAPAEVILTLSVPEELVKSAKLSPLDNIPASPPLFSNCKYPSVIRSCFPRLCKLRKYFHVYTWSY